MALSLSLTYISWQPKSFLNYNVGHDIDFMLRHKNKQNHRMSHLELFVSRFKGEMAFNFFEIDKKVD